jgi:thiol-disulfide isomerase/thioredoxin
MARNTVGRRIPTMFGALALALVAGLSITPTSIATAAQAGAEAKSEAEAGPTLKVGSKAPALTVEKWLKGDAIPEFKPGQAYVVEFWATWCGPCITAMPHLSKLAKKYKPDGIHFIGVNIWEQYGESTLADVTKFVAEQGDRMSYHVAYDGAKGVMAETWMKAAGRQGIPSAFIVDRTGTIAWMGHPMAMDMPLDMIAKNTWDPIKGPEMIKQAEAAMDKVFKAEDPASMLAEFTKFEAAYPGMAAGMQDMKLGLLLENKKFTEGYALAKTMVDTAITERDAEKLNQVAWMIVSPEASHEQRDSDLALRAAEKAAEFTENKSPDILDTLARAHFVKGNVDRAIEVQTQAVGMAEGRMKRGMERVLEEYKAAQKK